MNSCEVDAVVGVNAAVQDVEHRHRQQVRVHAAKVAVERLAAAGSGRPGDGQRDAEDGVRAEPRLGLGAVERREGLVEAALVASATADDGLLDLLVHVGDGLANALAAEALRLGVAQLDRLARPRRRAGRNAGPTTGAVGQDGVDLDRRIASRVEDLRAHEGKQSSS